MTGNSKQITPLIISLLVMLIICLESTAQQAEVAIRPTVLNIVSKLANERTVHLGDPPGLSSIPDTTNKYYKLYKKLGKIATDNELLALTNDTLNVIVVYS